MWLKKLKHKKLQFLLVGLMLFAIAAVFCTCVCFTLELKTYGRNRFSEDYCPDVYIYSLKNAEYKDNFPNEALWSNIKSASALRGKFVSVPIKHGDTNISSITNMLCTLEDKRFLKYIQISDREIETEEPGDGEIWVVKTLASSYNISVGDTLTLNYEDPIDLKVTAVFTATYAPSERLTIMANVVNENTLAMLNTESDAGIFALDLHDVSSENITSLSKSNPYAIQTFSRPKLMAYTTNISGIVGGVSALAALVVFLAALFIVRFIILDNIRKELRSIGIYKSLGYKSKIIKDMYLKAYLAVGTIAVVLGALISLPMAYYLGASMSEALGGFSLTATSILVCAGAILLLVLMLWGCASTALKQINNITPVEALSAGLAMGERKLTKSVIPNAKSSVATSINDIFKHKKTSLVTFLVLTVSIYLILFFAASYYTCMNIYQNANVWLACPKFDAIVTGQVNDNVVGSIQDSGYAKSALRGNFFYYPPVTIPQYDGDARAIEFIVLDQVDEETTGIIINDGKSPERAEEIAVTDKLLHSLNMEVGDYLRIQINDKTQDYLIYGTFSSMEAHAIVMRVDGMLEIDPGYEPGNCFVILNNDSDFDTFRSKIEGQFTSVTVDKEWTALKAAILAIEDMLANVMRVMLIIFIVFAVISIVNVLVLTINNKRRQYGILKSLGFTTKYMVNQNLSYILILFGIGTVVAALLHFTFSREIFAMLIIDAMIDSKSLTGTLLLGTGVLIVLVTLLLNLPIRRITPVDLMED